MSLTEKIKSEAYRLGFQLVGVTTSDPPPHLAVFESWLAAGRQGEMGYLATERARQRRADPRQILPECRSILVLAARYPAPEYLSYLEEEAGQEGEPGNPNSGSSQRVAAYAWGEDYHEVFPERLRALVAFIEAQVGHPIPNRWYTDTGPILERDLAQRAGLGWIGKNTCLIHPQQGSYFLLAEILLGIELQPDAPFVADHCGSCTRCLDACPTACILPDRTIDASRCISYLTIELKGPIPAELRPPMGEWIFGCDVCQQVCPWNERFAAPQGDLAFAPRPGVPPPELSRELSLTPQEFNRKFKGSPVKRTRRRGYLRNVAVALGNLGDERAVPDLARALLEDLEPLVRGHAAWALGQIGGEPARQTLEEALRLETDLYVLAEIRAALSPVE
jgi:epoxyqueuosine reductase